MVFRSLLLASLLLGCCAANPSAPADVQQTTDAITAVNAALAKKELVMTNDVPSLK